MLRDLLRDPITNNAAQAVIVRLLDGTNPFLFMRDPISQSWIIIRETEQDIQEALDPLGFWHGSVTREDREDKTIFPDVQLVEVESEVVFKEMLLSGANEEAANTSDMFGTRAVFNARLKHLLKKKST